MHARESVLGENHRDTLNTLLNMGRNYAMQGKNDQSKYQDAVVLFERCLALQKLVHGENHSDTIQTVLSLVKIYEKQKNYEEAENILILSLLAQKSIHTEKQLLESNPTTLQTIFSLAKIYSLKKSYDKAENLFLQCLYGRTLTLGVDHPDTCETLLNLCLSLFNLQRPDEAVMYLKQNLDSQSVSVARGTLVSISSLVTAYNQTGRSVEANMLIDLMQQYTHHIDV